MLNPECRQCHRANWAGRQEVTPPTADLESSGIWHRRTWCRFCGVAQEEIARGGLVPLVSRDESIDVQGSNPFVDRERETEP